MQITTTFRHMEPSEALKSYAEEKLERVKKYIDEPVVVQVFLTVEKIRHSAEVTITAKGITIKAAEETNDMYASVDAEDPKRPYSDQRLAELLSDHSIVIARRTVTKYREMLLIGSSSERKKHF